MSKVKARKKSNRSHAEETRRLMRERRERFMAVDASYEEWLGEQAGAAGLRIVKRHQEYDDAKETRFAWWLKDRGPRGSKSGP